MHLDKPGIITYAAVGPNRGEHLSAEHTVKCNFCGTEKATAAWLGEIPSQDNDMGHIGVCAQCAVTILPRLLADAVFVPRSIYNTDKRFNERKQCELEWAKAETVFYNAVAHNLTICTKNMATDLNHMIDKHKDTSEGLICAACGFSHLKRQGQLEGFKYSCKVCSCSVMFVCEQCSTMMCDECGEWQDHDND